nr:immunoglobulin light chain junction region [Macaca mulatta]MOV95978.1 immunoglobulin light chain junction region [Macaca mulatta]MOV96383.1 immunoglobulin light chain junction region [Macaca mulatta]MOV97975.1 immunoglobulin light chain junction region [Macaca mulatta]MOV98269.1 immunoglobulin light chain junction region [Macaca mulatta]
DYYCQVWGSYSHHVLF